MKYSHQSQSLIESTIKMALENYADPDQETVITDIHLQPHQGSGELFICNDDDEELACAVIDEWLDYDGDDFYVECERVLRNTLERIKETGALDNLSIVQPFSFVLVDEDKETISELLLIDEDTLLVNDDLLKGLDEELDEFLKDLLNN